MKLTSVTIILLIVSIIFNYVVLRLLKRDSIGIRSALIWFVLWSCIGFFSLFPHALEPIMIMAQMKNRMFFLYVVSIFIAFALIFNLFSIMQENRRNISRIFQEIAILKNLLEKKSRPDKEK